MADEPNAALIAALIGGIGSDEMAMQRQERKSLGSTLDRHLSETLFNLERQKHVINELDDILNNGWAGKIGELYQSRYPNTQWGPRESDQVWDQRRGVQMSPEQKAQNRTLAWESLKDIFRFGFNPRGYPAAPEILKGPRDE